MAFLRKKQVTLDGITITIGSVVSSEIDILLGNQQRIISDEKMSPAERVAALGKTWDQFIADGLNRGGQKVPEFTPATVDNENENRAPAEWNATNIHDAFDKEFLKFLRDQLMEMNGIGIRQGEGKTL